MWELYKHFIEVLRIIAYNMIPRKNRFQYLKKHTANLILIAMKQNKVFTNIASFQDEDKFVAWGVGK